MRLNDDGTYELSKPDVKALLAFASTDKSRAHLCCVRFAPARGAVYATDGHTALRAANCGRYGGCLDYSVPRALLARAARLLADKQDVLLVRVEGERVRLGLGQPGFVRVADGLCGAVDCSPYPPLDDCIPSYQCEEPGTSQLGVNFDYLARLALVTDAAGSKCGHGELRLGPNTTDPLVAFVRSAETDTEYTAVVMPSRL